MAQVWAYFAPAHSNKGHQQHDWAAESGETRNSELLVPPATTTRSRARAAKLREAIGRDGGPDSSSQHMYAVPGRHFGTTLRILAEDPFRRWKSRGLLFSTSAFRFPAHAIPGNRILCGSPQFRGWGKCSHVGRINIYAIQPLRVNYEHTCVPDSADTLQLVMGRSS